MYLIFCTLSVNCCMIPWTKTASGAGWMSTWGMVQWNSSRKLKWSSSSSFTNPPASLIVVGLNSPESLMVSEHWRRSSLCSNTVFTAWLWKFHLTVLALVSLCATTLSSTLVLLGYFEKKEDNPARSEKNWLTLEMWDVTCGMMRLSWWV